MIRGDELVATIEDLAEEGKSVARAEGLVVFVRGGVPGDRARIRIRQVKRNYAEAELLGVESPSVHRAEPRCRYFGTCGGCSLQQITYAAQLEFKRRRVADALEHLGGFGAPDVPAPIAMEQPYYYRNKMEFSFGQRWRTPGEMAAGEPPAPALGLHAGGRFDRVVDIAECWLQSEASVRIVNVAREFMNGGRLPVFSTVTLEGYLRHLAIRQSKRTREIMVNLVTAEERPALLEEFAERVLGAVPEVTTIVNNITRRRSQVAVGERETVAFGPGIITERLGRRTYRISANSFFQSNTEQAERLYDTALRFAGLRPADVVYDLYSGTGTIALHVAEGAARVIGMESAPGAVADARENASANGVGNCTFLLGELKETLISPSGGGADLPPPDVVIADPPRSGMHQKVVRRIAALGPRTVVYVSCNPATQARDLKILCEEGRYRLESIQPVDMFPQTYHIENVVSLSRSAP